MARSPRIMITAGEASGDRIGAGLARALLARRPDLELFGMGGEKMEAAGVRLVQDASEVAVVGIFEVLSHLPAIRRAKRRLEKELRGVGADLFVPIDFPDFNLRLAGAATRAGVPVVYFVSPQVWAWRPGRVKGIRRLVRRMLVLFPFETRFYEEAGVPVAFVGHPLAEERAAARSREELCRHAGLDPGRTTVALMPGSRRIEVERLLGVLLQAARNLSRERPDLQFLVPVAPLRVAERRALVLVRKRTPRLGVAHASRDELVLALVTPRGWHGSRPPGLATPSPGSRAESSRARCPASR